MPGLHAINTKAFKTNVSLGETGKQGLRLVHYRPRTTTTNTNLKTVSVLDPNNYYTHGNTEQY